MNKMRDCIFNDFDTLANIAENGCMGKKPDIRYTCTSNVKATSIAKYETFKRTQWEHNEDNM